MPIVGDDTDLKDRLFGQHAQPAIENRPGLEQRGDFRRFFEGPSGRESALAAPQKNPLLSDEDYARASLLMQQFAALIQNTNITASLPAHNAPNLWSTPVDLSAQVVIPGAVGSYQTVITYQAQPGRRVRISGYGVDVSSPVNFAYNGTLLWRITKNGIPVETLGDWGEHRGSVIRPRETFILLDGDMGSSNGGGDVIKFEVKRAVLNVDAATVQMALVGYTWRPRNNYEGTRASIAAF